MLILKRRYEFGLPASLFTSLEQQQFTTHLLTPKDIVFRCKAASVKAIISVGEDTVVQHIIDAHRLSSVESLISIGTLSKKDGVIFRKGLARPTL